MERKNNTAVFTVIFPANEIYLKEFTQSLRNQTVLDFDLVIMNDGVDHLPVELSEFNVIEYDAGTSIAETRALGISQLVDMGYEYVIFADSDDLMASNRVEKSIEILQEHDFVCNDLDLIDQSGNMLYEGFWSDRLNNMEIITPEFLKDQNIFGLGNTAARGRSLKKIHIPQELIAVDWYLFLNLITNDQKAVFTSQTKTLYRQYSSNIGLASSINAESLQKAVKVKLAIYDVLRGADHDFERRYANMQELGKKLKIYHLQFST